MKCLVALSTAVVVPGTMYNSAYSEESRNHQRLVARRERLQRELAELNAEITAEDQRLFFLAKHDWSDAEIAAARQLAQNTTDEQLVY